MIKYGDKWKDETGKYCSNGGDELDIEVKGGGIREMGITFGGYILAYNCAWHAQISWDKIIVGSPSDILVLTAGVSASITF